MLLKIQVSLVYCLFSLIPCFVCKVNTLFLFPKEIGGIFKTKTKTQTQVSACVVLLFHVFVNNLRREYTWGVAFWREAGEPEEVAAVGHGAPVV